MRFLLDTNVVSEPASRFPDARVLEWLSAQDSEAMYVSAVTLAEIEEGIARLPQSRRRTQLENWRDELIDAVGARLLAVDARVGMAWGVVRARLGRHNHTIAPLDGFIAATAEVHDMTVVTRNVRHFRAWGGRVLNPWQDVAVTRSF